MIYGIISTLEFTTATSIFIGFLLALFLLESIFHFLEGFAQKYDFIGVFEKLKKELMILGIISFITRLAIVDQCSTAQWFLAFEMSHIIVLYLAFSFVCQAFFLVRYAASEGIHFHKSFVMSSEDLLHQYEELKKKSYFRVFAELPNWIPKTSSWKSYAEYKIIQKSFFEEHNLPSRFQFANYAKLLFKDYISELGDVPASNWVILSVLVLLNALRNSSIDSTVATANGCFSHSSQLDSNSTSHRFLIDSQLSSSFSNNFYDYIPHNGRSLSSAVEFNAGCNHYILSYALFCALTLMLYVLVIYFASCVFLDKAMIIILIHQNIDYKSCNRFEAYSKALKKLGIDENKVKDDYRASAGNHIYKTESQQSMNMSFNDSHSPHSHRQQQQPTTRLRSRSVESVETFVEDFSKTLRKRQLEHDTEENKPWFERCHKYVMSILKTNANSHETTSEDQKIRTSDVFYAKSPEVYLKLVEIALLFQCFYVSIWATQLLPIATGFPDEKDRLFWEILLAIPVIINFIFMHPILHMSVMLQIITDKNSHLLETVIDISKKEVEISSKIRSSIYKKAASRHKSPAELKNYIKNQYKRFDRSQNGLLSQLEFRHFLAEVADEYLEAHEFKILWESIDSDLSGQIGWDELFSFVFSEFKYDLKSELAIVQRVRKQLKKKMSKVPKSDRRTHLYLLFQKYDKNNTGYMNKEAFSSFLSVELGMKDMKNTEFKNLNDVMHFDDTGNFSFDEFLRLVIRIDNDKSNTGVADDIGGGGGNSRFSRRISLDEFALGNKMDKKTSYSRIPFFSDFTKNTKLFFSAIRHYGETDDDFDAHVEKDKRRSIEKKNKLNKLVGNSGKKKSGGVGIELRDMTSDGSTGKGTTATVNSANSQERTLRKSLVYEPVDSGEGTSINQTRDIESFYEQAENYNYSQAELPIAPISSDRKSLRLSSPLPGINPDTLNPSESLSTSTSEQRQPITDEWAFSAVDDPYSFIKSNDISFHPLSPVVATESNVNHHSSNSLDHERNSFEHLHVSDPPPRTYSVESIDYITQHKIPPIKHQNGGQEQPFYFNDDPWSFIATDPSVLATRSMMKPKSNYSSISRSPSIILSEGQFPPEENMTVAGGPRRRPSISRSTSAPNKTRSSSPIEAVMHALQDTFALESKPDGPEIGFNNQYSETISTITNEFDANVLWDSGKSSKLTLAHPERLRHESIENDEKGYHHNGQHFDSHSVKIDETPTPKSHQASSFNGNSDTRENNHGHISFDVEYGHDEWSSSYMDTRKEIYKKSNTVDELELYLERLENDDMDDDDSDDDMEDMIASRSSIYDQWYKH